MLCLLAVILGCMVAGGVFFRKGRLLAHRVVSLLLVASVLLPAIPVPGFPDVRLELILVLVSWGLLLLSHLATGQPIRFHRDPVYKWFALFGLAILFSMTYASLVKDYPPIGRDFWELGKLLEYLLIFALVANLDISSIYIRSCYNTTLVVFLCSALFGLAQYLNLGSINTVVSPYYAPTKAQGILLSGRITGTMGNPNEFGALMVLAFSLSLSGVMVFQQKRLRLFLWGCLAVFGLTIVLTGSRSSLVALGVAIIFILLKFPTLIKGRRIVQIGGRVIIGLVVIGLLVVTLAPAASFSRFIELTNISSATSWQARVKLWRDTLALWKLSPLFGWGPGKSTMTTDVDNEWLLLLRRYGIVGGLIFCCWFLAFYRGLSRIRRNTLSAEVKALALTLQATFVSYAVYMIPAGVYHDLQLMPVIMVLLGVAYSQKHRLEVNGT